MKNRGLFGLPVPFRIVCAIALVFAVLSLTQAYVTFLLRKSDNPFSWFFYSTTIGSHYLVWVLLTPLLYRLSRIGETGALFARRRILTHIFLGGFVAAAQDVGSLAIRNSFYYVREHEWFPLFEGHGLQSIAAGWFEAYVEYWIIVGAFVAIDYYRRYRQKELELVRMENELNNARLNALRMQLRPHFLFNTLHTIASLMNENIGKAQKMVSQLGHLLRTILEGTQEQMIPLRDEIDFIRSYLDIEETRFQDRLRVDYEIAEETEEALVPSLILQPLVENAIKHGFAHYSGAGILRVTSNTSGGKLVLTVEDNGNGADDTGAILRRPGVGLANVLARLQQMYNGRARFELESRAGDGFVARVLLPLQTGGQGP